MRIANWQKESFIDYPGKISTLVFIYGCNFDCSYCHNPELKPPFLDKEIIDDKRILDYVYDNKKNWIEAVVISGGEPTTEPDLENFIKKLKESMVFVKIDTNGSDSCVLEDLLKKRLVDYVAMDVKGPPQLYSKIIGREIAIKDIEKGIKVTSKFPKYEFRTTVCPIYEEEKIRWMTPDEIGNTAKFISEFAPKESKYFLQPFKAIEKNQGNNGFLKKSLPKNFHETPINHLEQCSIEAKKYLDYVFIR